MKIIISESKREKMSELVEKSLHSMGKLMQCIEDLEGEDYGERDDDDDDDDDWSERGYRRNYRGGGYSGGMRRRRDSRGRYM